MAATVRVVDFTNVKEQGNFNPRRKKEGDYYAHIVSVDDHTSKSDNDGWVFTITVDGDARGSYPYYCGADEKQAWKIRGLFVAAGVAVPKKRLKIDPNKLVGKAIGISLEDDEYEGRAKSTIAGTIPVGDLTGTLNEPGKGKASKVDDEDDYDDDEDEAPPVKKGKAKKAAPEPDEDEDEEPAPKKARKAKKAPEPEPEDDDEDDDEDDEEETPPPPKKSKKAKAPKKKPVDEDDEDDDLDLDEL